MSPRLVHAVAAALVLLAAGPVPLAEAVGCQGCGPNSPILNTFPFMWLRSRSLRVGKGTSNCPIDNMPAVLVVEKADGVDFAGYQLAVVEDRAPYTKVLCAGAGLAGVTFTIHPKRRLPHLRRDPVLTIQQVRTTTVTRYHQSSAVKETSGRYLYFISELISPDASLCTHAITRPLIQGRRQYLSVEPSGTGVPVLQDHLAEYAVILPDAMYDNDGTAVSYAGGTLEWFEVACAGSALADTDLSGLVAPDSTKDERTAALYMFSAKYNGRASVTLSGTPILWSKGDYASWPYDTKFGTPPKVEARWTEAKKAGPAGPAEDAGATCMTHSRLWMSDTMISHTGPYVSTLSLKQSEIEFVNQFTRLHECDASPTTALTSYVVNHIHD
jgi:hypothetical protein